MGTLAKKCYMACHAVNLILYKPSDGGSTGKGTGVGKVNAYPD